jgi:hypothetical protein
MAGRILATLLRGEVGSPIRETTTASVAVRKIAMNRDKLSKHSLCVYP